MNRNIKYILILSGFICILLFLYCYYFFKIESVIDVYIQSELIFIKNFSQTGDYFISTFQDLNQKYDNLFVYIDTGVLPDGRIVSVRDLGKIFFLSYFYTFDPILYVFINWLFSPFLIAAGFFFILKKRLFILFFVTFLLLLTLFSVSLDRAFFIFSFILLLTRQTNFSKNSTFFIILIFYSISLLNRTDNVLFFTPVLFFAALNNRKIIPFTVVTFAVIGTIVFMNKKYFGDFLSFSNSFDTQVASGMSDKTGNTFLGKLASLIFIFDSEMIYNSIKNVPIQYWLCLFLGIFNANKVKNTYGSGNFLIYGFYLVALFNLLYFLSSMAGWGSQKRYLSFIFVVLFFFLISSFTKLINKKILSITILFYSIIYIFGVAFNFAGNSFLYLKKQQELFALIPKGSTVFHSMSHLHRIFYEQGYYLGRAEYAGTWEQVNPRRILFIQKIFPILKEKGAIYYFYNDIYEREKITDYMARQEGVTFQDIESQKLLVFVYKKQLSVE